MITARPEVIIAGAVSALPVLAARGLYACRGGYGLLLAALAALAASILTGPVLLIRLPTRAWRPIVVRTASGRGGLAGLVLATITALPAALGGVLGGTAGICAVYHRGGALLAAAAIAGLIRR